MNCEQMTMLLSARLDGEVTAQEEAQLQAHLAQCPECRALFEQLQTLHTSFSDLEEIPAPEGFARGVMERIKAENKPKIIPLFARPQVRGLVSLAACAVLVIGFGSFALNGGSKRASSMDAAPEAAAAYDMALAEEIPAGQADTYAAVTQKSAVEAPAPAPMEPAEPETTLGGTAENLTAGKDALLILAELPEGVEDALGQLHWEQRVEDGSLCARLSADQAEKLMELANTQGIALKQTAAQDAKTAEWIVILSQ